MNLFGYHLTLTRDRSPAPEIPAPMKRSAGAAVSPPWLRSEEAGGGAVLSNAYQQVVWVYRAINVLAEQVANIPFRFSYDQAGADHLITSGPLCDFYARPHPQINRFQYWELRLIWLMLRGECFRVPLYENTPAPHASRSLRAVLILDPARFQHIVENHQLVGWRYAGFGRETPLASQVFLPEEVWFEKLPNPFDFWRGLPPLALAGTAARTDFAAGAFMQGLIENNADTGIIVRTEQQLDDEQQEQLLAALRERKRKAGTADRPLLLWNTAEVIKPELSSSDLQFLENRKFSRAEICAAFGVPEEVVTTTDTAKYDVMSGARLNFIENRVMPLCRRLEAEEDATVKTLDPRASGWFDLESLPIMQEARRKRLATAKTGFDMGVPFNELNRVLDLGFKPLPWGNQGFLPAACQSLGQTPAPAASGLRAVAPSVSPEPQTIPAAAPERLLALLQWQSSCGADPFLLRKLRRFLFEQRARVLARLTGAASSSSACSSPLLDLASENRLLLACLTPLIRRGYEAHLQRLAQAQNLPPLTIPPDLVQDFAASRETDLAQLNQGTHEALLNTQAEAQAAQETAALLSARIRSLYNELAARTAPALAATESLVAGQSARLALARLQSH